jgi:hypothetical protein
MSRSYTRLALFGLLFCAGQVTLIVLNTSIEGRVVAPTTGNSDSGAIETVLR